MDVLVLVRAANLGFRRVAEILVFHLEVNPESHQAGSLVRHRPADNYKRHRLLRQAWLQQEVCLVRFRSLCDDREHPDSPGCFVMLR